VDWLPAKAGFSFRSALVPFLRAVKQPMLAPSDKNVG